MASGGLDFRGGQVGRIVRLLFTGELLSVGVALVTGLLAM